MEGIRIETKWNVGAEVMGQYIHLQVILRVVYPHSKTRTWELRLGMVICLPTVSNTY